MLWRTNYEPPSSPNSITKTSETDALVPFAIINLKLKGSVCKTSLRELVFVGRLPA